jgi:putative transposase
VRFRFIQAEKAHYPLTVLCRVLAVSRSGYYKFARRRPSSREMADRELTREIREIHEKSRRRYGSPRVHWELREERQRRIGRKRVARLMRAAGLRGRRRRKFCRTTDSDHGLPVAANLLNREFTTSQPNQVWVGDVTALWTLDGWLFLAVLLDLFSRRVVGYALSRRNDTQLALAALMSALRHRTGLAGLVHHTDQGSPYASGDYRAVLRKHGIICSMSRRGDCWDNAVAEAFFSTLKSDLEFEVLLQTATATATCLSGYIDDFYNPERRHSTLDYLSPIRYELKYELAQQST